MRKRNTEVRDQVFSLIAVVVGFMLFMLFFMSVITACDRMARAEEKHLPVHYLVIRHDVATGQLEYLEAFDVTFNTYERTHVVLLSKGGTRVIRNEQVVVQYLGDGDMPCAAGLVGWDSPDCGENLRPGNSTAPVHRNTAGPEPAYPGQQ